MASGTVTIVFTDLVGSTELLARGDEAANELRRGHFAVLREATQRHGGTEVKNLGDGLMLVFDSALSALACAKQIQETTERGGEHLAVRVGMNVGEPLREEGDYFGTPVVIASRLCARAEGGQVLVSELLRSLVAGRGGHEFRKLGPLELKGLAEPVDAAELVWREPEPRTRVRLCGSLELELEGRSVADGLRGGQVRSVLEYLLSHRDRAVSRSELIAVLWPEEAPKDPQTDLRPILSGLRRALAADVLEGKDQLRLVLPGPVWVDTEAASSAVEAAREAARSGDWQAVRDHARVVLDLLAADFLSGQEADWIETRRRELNDARVEALEWAARSALALGGTELGAAQRAARELISCSPYRESGYRYLMQAFAAAGNVAEALRVYEELRCLLRDELGTVPAPELQALHERLLTGDSQGVEGGAEQLALPASLARAVEAGAFVGRERELDVLQGRWEAAREGRPTPLMLGGDPGIGKTRLAAQFAQAVHGEGATVLYGRCDEEALGGYQPFVEALGAWAQACPLGELRTRAGAGAAELAGLVPELARRMPDLPAPPRADPELERYRLLDAVREVLAALATVTPVLLVLDDLHWADRSTLLMLKHLARAPGPAPVLIVGTFRETELARDHPLNATLDDLRREHQYERLSLTGLAEREAAALIASRAGHSPATELARAIHEETEGNPFFIEAVLAHLSETGAAEPAGGRLESAYAIARLGVPEGVKEVIRRRLAHLDEQSARALQIASVAGRDFELEHLARVAEIEGDALAELLEKTVAARLVEELPGTVGHFRFVHALIRETLYEQLTAARRVRLHRRIGEALELAHAGNEEPYLPALAHHFCEAAPGGDADKAIDYARRAGDAAMALLAYEQAAGHYVRALDVLAAGGASDERARLELLLGLGQSHANAGAVDPGRESFRAAAELARAVNDPEALARAALGFGHQYLLFVMRGAFDEELIGLLEDALARLPAGPSALRARLLARLTWELLYSPRAHQMSALSEEAVEIARATGDSAALAQALNARFSALAWNESELRERLGLASEALALSEQSGDGEHVAIAHENLVCALIDAGDFTTVDAEIAAVERLAAQTRIPQYLWYARQWSAMRALMKGRFDDGERLAHEALAVGRETIGEAAVLQFGFQLLTARWMQEGADGLDKALEGTLERMPNVIALRAALASTYAELGREGEARAEFDRFAAGGVAGLRQGESWLVSAFYVGQLCQLLGDAEHAAAFYPDLLPYADYWVRVGGASALCLSPFSRTLGQLAATMSSWTEAEKHFEAALGDSARAGALPSLGWTQADYAHMLLARARPGDRERALELLDEALRTARELGMKPLEQTAVALREQAQRPETRAAARPSGR